MPARRTPEQIRIALLTFFMQLWIHPTDDGANLAVIFPLSAYGPAIKITITLLLNILSTVLLFISYTFQVAIITPTEAALVANIGSFNTICVNNIHAPKSADLPSGRRWGWYILVFTSLLLHGVFNDIIGISNRYCAVPEPPSFYSGYHNSLSDIARCRADLSLRVIPLIITGGLLLLKSFTMWYAYAKHKQLLARQPVVESLRDAIVAMNQRDQRNEQGLLHVTAKKQTTNASGVVQTSSWEQPSIFALDKSLAWYTGVTGLGSGLGALGVSVWMLAVFNNHPPINHAPVSIVLPAFEVNGFSDSVPIAAYFGTAATAAAPQVMLAFVTLLGVSILETFYLNKAWVSIERGAKLSSLREHFTFWKPRSLPSAGHRGRVGLFAIIILPTLGHFMAGLALISQEVFCETLAYSSSYCSQQQTGTDIMNSGYDLSLMWTSYKLAINQIFLLLTGILFVSITSIILWIGNTKPLQEMPPFYGKPETIALAIQERIEPLNDKTKLRWKVHNGYSQLKGFSK